MVGCPRAATFKVEDCPGPGPCRSSGARTWNGGSPLACHTRTRPRRGTHRTELVCVEYCVVQAAGGGWLQSHARATHQATPPPSTSSCPSFFRIHVSRTNSDIPLTHATHAATTPHYHAAHTADGPLFHTTAATHHAATPPRRHAVTPLRCCAVALLRGLTTGFCHPVVQLTKTRAQLYAATVLSRITGYAAARGCAGLASHSVRTRGFGGVNDDASFCSSAISPRRPAPLPAVQASITSDDNAQ